MVRPDGKLLAVCTLETGESAHLAIYQFDSGGSLDTTFGTGGKSVSNVFRHGTELALAPGGGFAVLASPTPHFVEGDILVRYDGGGKLLYASGLPAGVRAVDADAAIGADGRAVVSATRWDSFVDTTLVVARYNTLGFPDKTFGTDGVLTLTPANAQIFSRDVTTLSDGRVLVLGIPGADLVPRPADRLGPGRQPADVCGLASGPARQPGRAGSQAGGPDPVRGRRPGRPDRDGDRRPVQRGFLMKESAR